MFGTDNASESVRSWGSMENMFYYQYKDQGEFGVGHGAKLTLRNFAPVSTLSYLEAMYIGRASSRGRYGLFAV